MELPQSSGYVDLHLHVLPGIDDGSRSIEASIEMMQGLQALGYTHLVATPHADDQRHTYGVERIERLHAETVRAAAAAGIGLTLSYGAEYAYGPRFHDDLQRRAMVTLAGTRYVLLELPEAFMPATMPNVLFEVGRAGYYPILAHPERCAPFHDDVARLEALASGRALIQVSFRSLAGTFGRTIKRTAWTLVEQGYADLVATDCHSPRELGKIVRPVLEELRERLPAPKLARLLTGTPNRLLTTA